MRRNALHRLTNLQVKNAGPGRHRDGGGLLLDVRPNGLRYWYFQYMQNGASHWGCIASARDVSLKAARLEAARWREAKALGRNPIDERNATRAAARAANAAKKEQRRHTLWSVIEAYHHKKNRPPKMNLKTAARWFTRIERYIKPVTGPAPHPWRLGDMPISKIRQEHIVQALEQDGLWETKHPTARALRIALHNVFAYAIATGFHHANPVDGIENLLATPGHKTEKRAAMPHEQIPAFMARLRAVPGRRARALEFLILTASRIDTVSEMQWAEVAGAAWVAPAKHMKGKDANKSDHFVPLSDRALAILAGLERGSDADRVFGSGKRFPARILEFLQKPRFMNEPSCTTHGFRTAINLWMKSRGYRHELREAVLAHAFGDSTSQSYEGKQDDKLLGERGPLMQAWADYCAGKSNVVALPQRKPIRSAISTDA